MITRRLKTALQREAISIVVMLIVFVGIVAFVQIAAGVRDGRSSRVDENIMLSMRSATDTSDPMGPQWIEEMARDTTALGGIPFMILLVLLAGGWLFLNRHYEMIVLLLFAMFGSLCLSFALKHAFDRPRPSLVPHETEVFSRSFPSSHSMMSAATYLTLAVIVSRVRPRRAEKIFLLALAILVTILIGVSRVYLGVHWPTDVLAGWIAGGVWAIVCWLLAGWTQRWQTTSPLPSYESEKV